MRITHNICWALILLCLCELITADLPVSVPLPGDKKANGTQCQSWWCPMLLSVSENTTLLYGMCKRGGDQQRNSPFTTLIRTTDAGKSWSEQQQLAYGLGQSAYSTRNRRITMLVGTPGPHDNNKHSKGLLGAAGGFLEEEQERASGGASPDPEPIWAQDLKEKPTAAQITSCLASYTTSEAWAPPSSIALPYH